MKNTLLLKEQHRNTRHDVIDKMTEIRAKWAKTHDFSMADEMMNEITGAIMNLKQREPIDILKKIIPKNKGFLFKQKISKDDKEDEKFYPPTAMHYKVD